MLDVEEERRDPEVSASIRSTSAVLVEAERLTHRLNVHLDNIQILIDERKNTL